MVSSSSEYSGMT